MKKIIIKFKQFNAEMSWVMENDDKFLPNQLYFRGMT